MSTIPEVSAEQLAKVFYHYQQALSGDGNGHDSQEESFSWDRASHNQRKLMVAAARLALIELATTPMESKPSRKFYGEPGKAEWGSRTMATQPGFRLGKRNNSHEPLYEFFMNS